MKNSIKTIGAMVMILFATMACKKEEMKEVDPIDQRFSVLIQTNSFEGKAEKAIMIGTKAQLEAALSGKSEKLYLKKVSEKHNVFTPLPDKPFDPNDPSDPIKECDRETQTYYDNNIDQWRQMANQLCQPITDCFYCPAMGRWTTFDIKPTSPKCNIQDAADFMHELVKFNFGDRELEYESIGKYILGR